MHVNRLEKLTLQAVVALASLVPIGAGGAGVLFGPGPFASAIVASADLDSHFRYLSGLLLAIGLAYASGIPGIETRTARFSLLTGIVVTGGAGRLFGMLAMGTPSRAMLAALAMELIVTPAIALWQRRVAKSHAKANASGAPNASGAA